jgi:hypothetical protein
MIGKAINSILTNDATVKAITTRCYPFVKIPQNPTYPFIAYSVFGRGENALRGPSGKENPRVQIDLWVQETTDGEAGYSNLRVLSKAVKSALGGYSGTVEGITVKSILFISDFEQKEPEVDALRIIADYSVWYTI